MSSAEIIAEAWQALEKSIIYMDGKPVGTVAAHDPDLNALNYDQCFVPSALAFLMKGEVEIVRNFLVATLTLQSHEPHMDCFQPGAGLMPASFKVEFINDKEILTGDFGEYAIASASGQK